MKLLYVLLSTMPILLVNAFPLISARFKEITSDLYTIAIEPKWENLELNDKKMEFFGSKWLLVGSITLKKKAKELVNLSQLTLRWQGPRLNNLVGSLYKKNPDRPFLPIENQLLCDGEWNKTRQTLAFHFDQQLLGPLNIFYVTLILPPSTEELIKNGSFVLDTTALPRPYRTQAILTHIALAFRDFKQKTAHLCR
jgi:hypothetical protein